MNPRSGLLISIAPLALSVILTTVVACGDDDAPLPPTFEPETGQWFYDELSVAQNTCPNDFYSPTDATIAILYEGGNSFDVNPGTDSAFDCSLSGEDFECPNWSRGSVPIPGLTATVDFRVNARGAFSSETSASGENTYTYTCEGSQCEAVEMALAFTFPCSVRVNFELDRQ